MHRKPTILMSYIIRVVATVFMTWGIYNNYVECSILALVVL